MSLMQAKFSVKQKSWLKRAWEYLYPFRPRFRNRHFWVILGLVLVLSAHNGAELKGLLVGWGLPYYVPVSLFLAPVVYAALTFGFAGAVATSLVATVITIPNFIFWHQGMERWGEIFQIFIVNVVAFLVGRRVDREKQASQLQKEATTALDASNTRYRSLLESSPIAVLVIDPEGTILEVNPAANGLFGGNGRSLKKDRLANLIGTAGAERLLSAHHNGHKPDHLTIKLDGAEVCLQPTLAEANDGKGNIVIQVLLRDVTEEYHRQAGLRAYAAHVMQALEEERQLIARGLHDETIQNLALLCRRLGMMESESESLSPSLTRSLQEARKTAEDTMSGLRRFARTLRPPTLDDLGMVVSIRRLLSDFAERSKIDGQLRLSGDEQRLPTDVELALFRIAQEALWNVEHHAKATRVVVTITFAESYVKLNVVDDGAGFSMAPDANDFLASGHLGLISMQERAEALGGQLQIHSNAGKGTNVSVSIPVKLRTPHPSSGGKATGSENVP